MRLQSYHCSIVGLFTGEPRSQFAEARVAIRDRFVAAVRIPFSQLLTRPTFTAAAVANPYRWVLSRNNREPLPPGQIVRLLIRFDGYRGKYTFHCHNLEHEDMMMANFAVV
jgi:spore coat protein A, manganese oxidase